MPVDGPDLLLGAVLAAGWLRGSVPGMPDLRWLALTLLLVFFLLGLAWELARALRGTRPLRGRVAPTNARPADGVVELVPMEGAIAEENSVDPRIRRFLALGPSIEGGESRIPGRTSALLGRISILSLFVGFDGRGWTDQEVVKTYRSLKRAGEWLEREANRWGAPVNVQLVEPYLWVDEAKDEGPIAIAFVPEGDHEAPFEADAGPRTLILFSRCAARLGFADAEDMITQVGRRVPADAWVWLLHVRAAGRSLAITDSDTEWPGVTLAVCYAREASLPEPLAGRPYPDSTTFAHELLHLFGATDKYTTPLHTFPPRLVSDRDIMCLYHDTLSRLRIDGLTAAEIGWIDRPARAKRPPPP
jgi:hypothetical protein